MRIAFFMASIAILAACDTNAPTGQEPSGPIRSAEPADGVPANTVPDLDPVDVGELPPPSAAPRFAGQWAAEQDLCETTAWRFTDSSLHTPAGSVCSFNRVTEVPGGYDIQATCTAEGPPTSDTLEIRFAESAKAMLFESETIADAGLVFCGREA